MDGVGHLGVVGKTDDRFLATFHHERRARRDAIVADQRGRPEVRVHLLGEFLDLDLIVSDLLASDRVGDGLIGARAG